MQSTAHEGMEAQGGIGRNADDWSGHDLEDCPASPPKGRPKSLKLQCVAASWNSGDETKWGEAATGNGFVGFNRFDCAGNDHILDFNGIREGDVFTFHVGSKEYTGQVTQKPRLYNQFAIALKTDAGYEDDLPNGVFSIPSFISHPCRSLLCNGSGGVALCLWKGAIGRAAVTIRVAAFGLGRDVANDIEEAVRRGVKVYVLIDYRHTVCDTTSLAVLENASNLHVKYVTGRGNSVVLHAKLLIVDGSTMVTGSANATSFSEKTIEHVLFCDSLEAQSLVNETKEQFDRLWEAVS